jgi:hypothetical protein
MIREVEIDIYGGSTGFAEDKDEARRIRVNDILPALSADKRVTLDFAKVTYSTQSFVHALLGEALQRYGENVLDEIEFRNCTPQLQILIQLVVDYSLGGFQEDSGKGGDITPRESDPPPEEVTARRSTAERRPASKKATK